MECYLEMKELTILIHATMWMNPKVMLSERAYIAQLNFILENVNYL